MDYSGDYSHDYGATAPLTRLRGELIQMNRALRDLQSTLDQLPPGGAQRERRARFGRHHHQGTAPALHAATAAAGGRIDRDAATALTSAAARITLQPHARYHGDPEFHPCAAAPTFAISR